jgi:hypothetical protein
MTRKMDIRSAGKSRGVKDERLRARQWKRWGAYLAECECALLVERELAPARIETTR